MHDEQELVVPRRAVELGLTFEADAAAGGQRAANVLPQGVGHLLRPHRVQCLPAQLSGGQETLGDATDAVVDRAIAPDDQRDAGNGSMAIGRVWV